MDPNKNLHVFNESTKISPNINPTEILYYFDFDFADSAYPSQHRKV